MTKKDQTQKKSKEEKEQKKNQDSKESEGSKSTKSAKSKDSTKKGDSKDKSKKESNKKKKNILDKKINDDDEAKWYVLMAKSGREQKIAKALNQRIEATGLEDIIQKVVIPVQKKIVVKDGEQQIKEERIFPGYVLIKMVLDKSTWQIITNTEGVSGFVRTTKYPRPLPEEEVKAIMKFMELEQPAFKAGFSVGDAVKIKEGAFADFVGSVSEIDESKGKVKVLISIFGRETPVELEFDQVNKL